MVHECGTDRVKLYVIRDATKLSVVADEPVIAFVLPERLARQAEQPVGFSCGESLQRVG